MTPHHIPRIDIASLFSSDAQVRTHVDGLIQAAARDEGMMVVTGLPAWATLDAALRRRLLALFTLPELEIRRLWRWNFEPTHTNVYRGWFPLQDGVATYKRGIDMGPDVAVGPSVVDATDPLREATPLPDEDALPGWRQAVKDYYLSMERMSKALMQSVARGLGLAPDTVIAPLALPGMQPFEPFYFGDHLWDVATRFVEQKGIAHLHTPRGRPVVAA